MAVKNRKKKQSSHPIVPAPFAVVMVLASSLSLSYLWLGSRCEALGREIKMLEKTSAELHRKCLYEESKWANMMAPREIERALRRYSIAVAWPGDDQIVRLDLSENVDSLADGTQVEFAQYAQVHRSPRHEQ